MSDLAALTAATAHLPAPLVALDLPAVRANAGDLVRRAAGTPVRVASKSVRCRYVLDLALGTPGFAGVMAYSVREAIWLAHNGIGDILVGLHQWEMLSVDNVLFVLNHPDLATIQPLRFYILRGAQVHRGWLQPVD